MSKMILAVVATLAICMPAFAGDVITDDFNGGVFTAATTGRATNLNGNYDWAGAGDSLDGWTALIDFGTVQAAGTEIYLQTGLGSFGPQGTNNSWAGHFGAGTADGNVGGYYSKQNDVPKSGWEFSTTLTAGMGGGRNANGDALAFVLIYDSELSWIHPSRGAVGKTNAALILDGTSYSSNSPLYYRTTRPDTGDPYTFNFTPTPADLNVDSLPTATLLNTTDGAQDAAFTGIHSGVIEQVVSNGATITARFLNNRYSEKTVSPSPSNWQYMATAVDNVQVVALEAGDANGDLLVDASDIGALLSGFGTGTAWTEGDFNDDDLVDASDVGDILTNFTGDPGPAPAGSVIAEYDTTTGNIVVSVDGVQNWLIEAADGAAVMTGDPANLPGAGGLVTDNDFRVGESNFGGPFSYTDLDLGDVAITGLVQGDLIAKWQTGFGAPTETIEVVVIPEPASMMLLGLGGLLVLRRRRAA